MCDGNRISYVLCRTNIDNFHVVLLGSSRVLKGPRRQVVVSLLGARYEDTRKELSKTNILTKNSNTTSTNDRVTRETVSVRLPWLSAGILPPV